MGKQQDTRLNEHKVIILRCIFVSIIIASDPQSVRSWGSDAIIILQFISSDRAII